ncbi:hypothetical protein PHLGIDRAFT_246979 [Phlebiopsis gigantea 11061_1 CR5-6]|uniref:N-acetyltransferase domain-containing protein n=1 Tax=Phlebiopsis gigantea (strain 11061_1 CR5-6) TaxID=745531 RepID=A0A0C3RSB5_PHLG1|nr:hypothetical protein PHLGIDRAFT_246979 [Phlebiopsis gigantea 11061_1 CR5-6]
MSWINSYQSPKPVPLSSSELYGPDPFDVNFVLPINLELLETARVKLVPFVPRIHAEYFWSQVEASPDLLRYYPFVLSSLGSFLEFHETFVRRDPAHVVFAIVDKTRPDAAHPEYDGGSLAGIIGLFHYSAAQLSTEIGFVVVLPAFQRTHVASNAVGILQRFCLDLPTATPPGLGLRRVEWNAHTKNLASARLAERMGFVREGVKRWAWVLPEQLARDGEEPREGDEWPEKPGRHTVVLSCCWDDWEGGAREVVQGTVDRGLRHQV